ncbi:MAG: DUF362 domain-containing protein [Deferrisomatales bacterium]|nr:DUF362 domain-containing protein [Deferrisomatales bacterium]
MSGAARVARVGCPGYGDAERAFRRALDLLTGAGDGPFGARGEPLLVKPNLLAAHPADRGVTTHPALVDAALAVAADVGARAVVADSPGLGSAERVARACGVARVCRRHGVPLVDLGAGPGTSVSGATYRGLVLAREAVEARWLWNLPKWKTHTMMGLTLGVKNLFGCVPGKRKVAAHFRAGKDPALFARHLLDVEAVLRPCLTVLDGVVAMDGPGPSRGRPVGRGLLLASADAPALDAEATRLSGFAAEDVPTVAESLRSGRVVPARVQVLGDPAEPLRFEPAAGSPCDWPLPGFLKRWVRGAVSPSPRFRAAPCTGCGVCVDACPAGALRAGTPPELTQETCIRCYCCQELCPTGAVQVPRRRFPGFVSGRGGGSRR